MFALESPAVWLGHGYLQLVAAANGKLAEGTAEGITDGELLAQGIEPDETRQAITFLVVCLIGIAVLLAVLTAWYWHFTSPKRRASSLLTDLGHYETDPGAAMPAPMQQQMPVLAETSLVGSGGPSPVPDHIRLPSPTASVPVGIDDPTIAAPAFHMPTAAPAQPPSTPPPSTPPPSTRPPSTSPPAAPPHSRPAPSAAVPSTSGTSPAPSTVAPAGPPAKTPRRAAGPSSKRPPKAPRRIEVAARNGGSGDDADRAPILPDRQKRSPSGRVADPAPSPVETKTGKPAQGDPVKPSSGDRTRAAATITQRGPIGAPKPVAATVEPQPIPAPASKSAAPASTAATSDTASGSEEAPPRRTQNGAKSGPPTASDAKSTAQQGLSDDDWAAVMQSAFNKLKQ